MNDLWLDIHRFNISNFEKLVKGKGFSKINNYERNKWLFAKALEDVKRSGTFTIKDRNVFDLGVRKLRRVEDRIREKYGAPKLPDLIKDINELTIQNKLTPVRPARLARFREVAKKLRLIAKGATKPGAKILEAPHWGETIGIKLNIDGHTYEGRIHMGYVAANTGFFKDWNTRCDSDGVSFKKRYSFEEYMNKVVIPSLKPEDREKLKKICSSVVEYYTLAELATLQVHFDHGKVTLNFPCLNKWAKVVRHKQPSEQSYKKFLRTLPQLKEKKTILKGGGQKFMYVVTTDKKMYVQLEAKGIAHHTSLSRGHAILCAGEMVVKDGTIERINTGSGHYKPSAKELYNILKILRENEVNLEQLKISWKKMNEQGVVSKEVLKGETQILAWMDAIKAETAKKHSRAAHEEFTQN